MQNGRSKEGKAWQFKLSTSLGTERPKGKKGLNISAAGSRRT